MPQTAANQTVSSVPALQQTLTLETLNALKVFKRCYRLVDYNLYLGSVIVRVRGDGDPFATEIDTVAQAIDALLKAENDYFDARLEALKAQLGKIDPQALGLTFTHPETVVASMRTPKARQYLDLILKLETACQWIYAGWFAGRLDDGQQLSMSLELQRRLTKLSSRINTLAKGLARRVINQDDQENQTYTRLLGEQAVENEGEENDSGGDEAINEKLLDRVESLVSSPEKSGSRNEY